MARCRCLQQKNLAWIEFGLRRHSGNVLYTIHNPSVMDYTTTKTLQLSHATIPIQDNSHQDKLVQ